MLTSNKFLLSFSLLFLLACQQNVSSQQLVKVAEKEESKVSLTLKGTVQHISLEGGFYGIVTSDGKKILPINLDKSLQQHGAIIEFSGNYKNVMTIQQWGKPFVITEFKLIKAGQKKSSNSEI